MNGLWLSGGRLSQRDDLHMPKPVHGETRVRVLVAGICGTDLALVEGLYPFEGVPGHEFVGIVEDGPAHLAGNRPPAQSRILRLQNLNQVEARVMVRLGDLRLSKPRLRRSVLSQGASIIR